MHWYFEVLKKYAVFHGRAHRAEFWYFTLFNVMISVILSAIDVMVTGGAGLISGIYGLAVLLPNLGVSIRRLHDTDRTGWWLLIGLIPLVGFIVLVVFACQEGTQGPNRHGPDPRLAPV